MNPFCALVCGKNSNSKRFAALPSSRELRGAQLFLLRGRRGEARQVETLARSLARCLAAGGDGEDVKR